jgi:hypothetical protein
MRNLIIVVLCLTNVAYAAEGDRMVYGIGMVTCAKWQKTRSTGDRRAEAELQDWVDGFLSGYNTASDDKDFIAPKPEDIAYYAWIDNYCTQKPLDRLAQAVVALKNELIARAR